MNEMEVNGDVLVKNYEVSSVKNSDMKYLLECMSIVEYLSIDEVFKMTIKENSVYVEIGNREVNNSLDILNNKILKELLNVSEKYLLNKLEKSEIKEEEYKLYEEIIIENEKMEEIVDKNYINKMKEDRIYFNIYHKLDENILNWLNSRLKSELLLKEKDLYIYNCINI